MSKGFRADIIATRVNWDATLFNTEDPPVTVKTAPESVSLRGACERP